MLFNIEQDHILLMILIKIINIKAILAWSSDLTLNSINLTL